MKNANPFPVILIGLVLAICSTASVAEPIPHSTVSDASGNGITNVYYGCATERYAHGVLGDKLEGGCLVARDSDGKEHQLDLPEHQVFEDLVPRIADINSDGINDVVTIRRDSNLGAAIVVYTIQDDRLTELAETPPIGRAYRWLAPAGIADFNGNGVPEIAYVQTPHIGGILKIWEMQAGALKQLASHHGVSNHAIGSKVVSQSVVRDHNNDGLPDLALPDNTGQRIWVFSMKQDLAIIDDIPMDAAFFSSKEQ